MVPPFMVASSHNLLNILASSTERCILCGLRLTGKWNALPLERYYAPLLTRSNIWISSYATIVLLPIVLWALPCYNLVGRPVRTKPPIFVFEPSGEIHYPQPCATEVLNSNSRSRAKLTLGDLSKIVTFRLGKKGEKLSMRYHPASLTVSRKHYSIIKVDSADRRATHN